MKTTVQISAEIEVAERFAALWKRMKKNDNRTTQGEVLDEALKLLEAKLSENK